MSNSLKVSVGEHKGGRERPFRAGKSHNLRARQEPSPPTLLWDERGKWNEMSLSDLLFWNCFPKQTKQTKVNLCTLPCSHCSPLVFVKLHKRKTGVLTWLDRFTFVYTGTVFTSAQFLSTQKFFLFSSNKGIIIALQWVGPYLLFKENGWCVIHAYTSMHLPCIVTLYCLYVTISHMLKLPV